MMRKIAIGLAAAAIATGGLTLNASAYRSGPGHHGGVAKGGTGKYGMYRGGTPRGGVYRTEHKFGPRQYGYHGHYRPGRHFDHWRHHWRPGYSCGTYYGGTCWRNAWTPSGWTRQWVCGSRPYGYGSYGHGYYRHGHGPRYGHWGGGPRPSYGRR
jgi:hypothetical protein